MFRIYIPEPRRRLRVVYPSPNFAGRRFVRRSLRSDEQQVVLTRLGRTTLPALFLGALIGLGACRSDSRGAAAGPTATAADSPGAPASSGASTAPDRPISSEPRQTLFGLEWDQPIEARQMDAVEIMDLWPQVRRMADRLQPGAALVAILAFETTHGRIDLTGDRLLVYTFEFVGDDPSLPAGKQAVERSLDIEARRGRLHGERHNGTVVRLKEWGSMEPPTCSSVRAWDAVTKSGVPDGVTSQMRYVDNGRGPGGPWGWDIEVMGHEEHHRFVDGKTCAILATWAR